MAANKDRVFPHLKLLCVLLHSYLDRGRFLPAHLKDAHQEFSLQTVIFKLISLSGCHILQWAHTDGLS